MSCDSFSSNLVRVTRLLSKTVQSYPVILHVSLLPLVILNECAGLCPYARIDLSVNSQTSGSLCFTFELACNACSILTRLPDIVLSTSRGASEIESSCPRALATPITVLPRSIVLLLHTSGIVSIAYI